jgi:hypothetical protein
LDDELEDEVASEVVDGDAVLELVAVRSVFAVLPEEDRRRGDFWLISSMMSNRSWRRCLPNSSGATQVCCVEAGASCTMNSLPIGPVSCTISSPVKPKY